MEKVLNVYKPIGSTPLDMVKKLKEKYPSLKDKKIGYAGRLDPMAHGVLILLIYPETKRRDYYQNLSKKYEFTTVFGIKTDSFDILGLPNNRYEKIDINVSKVKSVLESFTGEYLQQPPAYSAIRVDGKPLYWLTRHNKINTSDIPKKHVTINNIRLIKLFTITSIKLQNTINVRISKVEGDFRQSEIAKQWEIFFRENDMGKLLAAKFEISVTSGTYIRSISNDFGKRLGTFATALEIKRTAVGKYKLAHSLSI